MKSKLFLFFFFGFIFLGFPQSKILCSSLPEYIKIENGENAPLVATNNDGTLSLTFNQQYITDIFSKYNIYTFNKSIPDENWKWYSIYFDNLGLVNEIQSSVSSDILYFENSYTKVPEI